MTPTLRSRLLMALEAIHAADGKIHEVAKRAGIARSTLYDSLHSPGRVKIETADKILEAASHVLGKTF
jgi:DNA-binding phage protein